MKVPFLNLGKVNDELSSGIDNAIGEVCASGHYILGQNGREFEQAMARELFGQEEGHVVGCNSGTDALVLSLLAAGVGPGDEAIVVSHTAVPTVAAIASVGATPVFVDIHPETWVMDPSCMGDSLTPRTKAIVPVHLYGNMADLGKIAALLAAVNRQDVIIIEDAAQAQGAVLRGRQAGALGRFGAFSFYPTKNIGALGDGGAVCCRSAEDLQALRILRNYGLGDRNTAVSGRGINSRLDEMQAAILRVKLPYLKAWLKRKELMMAAYRRELAGLPIVFQQVTESSEPAWHLCVIALEEEGIRGSLMDHLARAGIETLIHYPTPTHKQKAFATPATPRLPVTEDIAGRILSLPFNTALTEAEQEMVIEGIRSFFSR